MDIQALKTLSCLLICLLLVIGSTGCNAAEIILESKNNEEVVLISPGQQLAVKLQANPTTGYQWVVTEKAAFLEQVGEPEFETLSDRLGAPSMQICHFRATGAGEGRLVLDYIRPWEKDKPARDRFSVTVQVVP